MQTTMASVKDALFQKAVELSRLLAQTEELQAYTAAEADMLNDAEVRELRQRVDEAEWAIKEQKDEPGVDGSALLTRLYLAKGKWQKHPKVIQYYKAQHDLQRLLDRINEVVTYPISGEQDPTDPSCGPCQG